MYDIALAKNNGRQKKCSIIIKMKSRYKILLFLFPLLCSVIANTQSMDSIQQKVLQSVQSKMGNMKNLTGGFLDSDIIKFTQDQINGSLESLNKGLTIAKQMGNIKGLQGGYYNLTKLDSAEGNYKNAYEHYKLYTLS